MLLMFLVQGQHLESTELEYGKHNSSLVGEKTIYQRELWD